MTALIVPGTEPVSAVIHSCEITWVNYLCYHSHEGYEFLCPVYLYVTPSHILDQCVHGDIAAAE
jgi:hypothetical protein